VSEILAIVFISPIKIDYLSSSTYDEI